MMDTNQGDSPLFSLKVCCDMLMQESVTKAAQGMSFVCDDLQAALGKADSIAAIVLLKLVEQATQLRQRIEALEEALKTPGESNAS